MTNINPFTLNYLTKCLYLIGRVEYDKDNRKPENLDIRYRCYYRKKEKQATGHGVERSNYKKAKQYCKIDFHKISNTKEKYNATKFHKHVKRGMFAAKLIT